MVWLLLAVAGIFEIGFAVALSRSEGFTQPLWVLAFAVCAAISLGLLSHVTTRIPIGTAYAVWTGIGAAGTALIGIALLGEPAQAARVACIALIVVAVVGLQLTSTGHA